MSCYYAVGNGLSALVVQMASTLPQDPVTKCMECLPEWNVHFRQPRYDALCRLLLNGVGVNEEVLRGRHLSAT